MKTVCCIVFGLTVSGSLMVLVLLAAGKLLKGRFGWGWQYYIWLAAVFQLLVPFSFGKEVVPALSIPYSQQSQVLVQKVWGESFQPGSFPAPSEGREKDVFVIPLWLIWIAGAAVTLGSRSRNYFRFLQCLRAGWSPVTDDRLLERFQSLKRKAGVYGKVRLFIHPDLSSPMTTGVFFPCVVLPCADLPEPELNFTVLHELTHCRRKDALYKWLVQFCICLHWFNPLVYRMEKEISRLCELSCDEAILFKLDPQQRIVYGDTLVHSLQYSGSITAPHGSLTLKNENSLMLLKERLGAVMTLKQKSKGEAVLAGIITGAVVCMASFTGVRADEFIAAPVQEICPDFPAAEGLLENFAAVLNISGISQEYRYTWPVGGDGGYISAEYEEGRHNGLDIAAESGTPIYSVADGKVLETGFNEQIGRYIIIQNKDDVETCYYHCSSQDVVAGQNIRQGDQIGGVGATGWATGPHLHIEFYVYGSVQKPGDYLER